MPWPLYLLLIAVPGALVAQAMQAPPLVTFLLAALGIVPLAGLIGDATEGLAERVGPVAGGLLNATFGNAAEFIIGLSALAEGLPDIVRAAIAGAIISNSLFALGTSMLAGGWRFGVQRFESRNAGQYSLMLALAVIGLSIPSLLATIGNGGGGGGVRGLALHEMSYLVGALLLVSYAGYILYSVFGVRARRRGPEAGEPAERTPAPAETREAEAASPAVAAGGLAGRIAGWRKRGPWFDIAVLVIATALVAVVSELLTGAIEPITTELGLSGFFVGLIVLPLIGGAAEFSSAMRAAVADNMETTLAIAAGSSIQIPLLIAPLLILLGPVVGHPLDLDFTLLELVIFGLVAGVFALISLDGESTWLEGLQLLVFFLIVAVGAFFIPR
ncbi:MAG TPA: calcium/proton exchanger [Ktedonobacterales bacterium]|nr:calcium/proton exchanger [Ktedonobacterales bacterium]